MKVAEEQKFNKMCQAKEYECRRARHDAEEWQRVSEELGRKKIELMLILGDEKRHRLYERIGWLLLSISLVLAHHL